MGDGCGDDKRVGCKYVASFSMAVRRLREAVREAVQDPQFRAGMEAAGQPLDYRDAPEFRSFWETDAKKMADVVRRIGRLEDKK
jgi:tripartite-type tricarboxylate transporter receptor subunit TctC